MNKADIRKQRGQVMVLMVLMMVMLLGFSAISIDVIRIFMIRNELQNAADAAALTGANYLYPLISTGPNWSLAQTKAIATARLNSVDNTLITDATVQTGFWNLTGTPSTLQSTSITPKESDLTAVKVTISKATGKNGGPVQLLFGPIVGLHTVDVGASAIAVTGGPASLKSGKIFPMAIAESTYDSYWNSATNSPKINPSTGKPYSFSVGGNGTSAGSWTTFNVNTNATSTLRSFITSGNPISYDVGDYLWINPGSKGTSVYSTVPTNVDVIVPIVPHVTINMQKPILGFGVIHIISSTGGNTKVVQAQLSSGYKTIETPATYSYGVYTPSRLVN